MATFRRRRRGSGPSAPWLLVVPAFAFLLAFHFLPSLSGFYYALTDWDGLTDARFVGFDNFRELWRDSTTRSALENTLLLAAAFFVAVNVIGLALAVGLHRTLKSRNVLRAVFFAPVVVSPLAVAFVWQYIFQSDGALNRTLDAIGLDGWQHPWLGDPSTALWAILVTLVWQFSGFAMVIYLAGLQSIPDELYEASALDGAGTWLEFRRLTLPLLAPAVTINATLTLVFGLRLFDQVLALTGGGPGGATETLATQVYKQAFVFGRFGYSTALALVLTLLIAALSIVQLLVLRRRERATA